MPYNNNEYKNTYIDINECTSRGACSISPTISALQELAIALLQNLAHYILELEELGANNENIKYEIITFLASLISINEFNDKQLFDIIQKEYYLLTDAQKTYNEICTKKNIPPKELRRITKLKKETTLSQAIAMGEKIFLDKYKRLTTEQKNLITILLIVIKSISLNMIKLCDYNSFDENIYHKILTTLDLFNHHRVSNRKIQETIDELAKLDSALQLKISQLLLDTFGGISKVKVSHSTRKGKAILVSGNNFFDLLKVLECTKDKEIDVYTHSNLLITHALKRFSEFEHLRGHFGNLTENCILDFATFPGSILITKNSKNTSEYLYRGRLFSNDYIVPNGVIKIENDDYSELIDSAENAKGFSKGKIKEDTILGYNEVEIKEKINKIIEKLNNNELEKLYIVGIDAHLELQKEYFNKLFSNLNDSEYVISFSYASERNNVLTIPIGNYIPLATNILSQIFRKYPITSNKLVFFFTTCDVMSISNIITLTNSNAKNIYMDQCSPTIINPSVLDTFRKKYNVTLLTDAEADLKNIRSKL